MRTSAELAAASARSGDAAPMDGERAPLLRAGASATPSSRGDARRDRRGSQTHAPSRGVFAALGALAACGIIAVVHGGGFPAHSAALGDAAPSAIPRRAIGRLGQAGSGVLGKDFSADQQCPSPLKTAAESKGISGFPQPDDCELLVVCGGSPRAGSTAQCTIAADVLELIMTAEHEAGRRAETKPLYTGYWNYHLHVLCDDAENCESKFPAGPIEGLDAWKAHVAKLWDVQKRDKLAEGVAEMEKSIGLLDKVRRDSVVLMKSHEFDGQLMSMCRKRLILTSDRDKEEVFDSGVKLKWFDAPKWKSRPSFEKYFKVWSHWKECWNKAAEADTFHTRSHSLHFDALSTQKSFRREIKSMVLQFGNLLDIAPEHLNADEVVERTVEKDYQEELNTELSTGTFEKDGQENAGSKTAAAHQKGARARTSANAESQKAETAEEEEEEEGFDAAEDVAEGADGDDAPEELHPERDLAVAAPDDGAADGEASTLTLTGDDEPRRLEAEGVEAEKASSEKGALETKDAAAAEDVADAAEDAAAADAALADAASEDAASEDAASEDAAEEIAATAAEDFAENAVDAVADVASAEDAVVSAADDAASADSALEGGVVDASAAAAFAATFEDPYVASAATGSQLDAGSSFRDATEPANALATPAVDVFSSEETATAEVGGWSSAEGADADVSTWTQPAVAKTGMMEQGDEVPHVNPWGGVTLAGPVTWGEQQPQR